MTNKELIRDSTLNEDLLPVEELLTRCQQLTGNYPGVYFLFWGDELVYVGSSMVSVISRIGQHVSSDKVFDSFVTIEEHDVQRIARLEADYIYRYEPDYNMMTPGTGRYYSKHAVGKLLKIEGKALNRLLHNWRLQPDRNGRYDIHEIQRLLEEQP